MSQLNQEQMLAEIRKGLVDTDPMFLFLDDDTLVKNAILSIAGTFHSRFQAQPVTMFLAHCLGELNGKPSGIPVDDNLFEVFGRAVRASWLGFMHDNPTISAPDLTPEFMRQFSIAWMWLICVHGRERSMFDYVNRAWLMAAHLSTSGHLDHALLQGW